MPVAAHFEEILGPGPLNVVGYCNDPKRHILEVGLRGKVIA